jgi:hypothetical protein
MKYWIKIVSLTSSFGVPSALISLNGFSSRLVSHPYFSTMSLLMNVDAAPESRRVFAFLTVFWELWMCMDSHIDCDVPIEYMSVQVGNCFCTFSFPHLPLDLPAVTGGRPKNPHHPHH